VTHNRENLQWFDRTINLRDGRIETDTAFDRRELPKTM
jgi:ABC-type lipoprotein export system ATPase subunit